MSKGIEQEQTEMYLPLEVQRLIHELTRNHFFLKYVS
jgi:hypothetical protein